jgi:uncharacterized membrane protein YqaE (UPF0057 family)
MTFWRALLAVIFPPLSVLDYGCGTVLIVTVLTLIGYLPGIAAALYINIESQRGEKPLV